jgi:flagellar basal-body rod modification protein FlgD
MSIVGLETVKMAESAPSPSNKNILGKDDFLQLLVTQLQAQDPLNPLESAEFTAQLAQFSSLEQLQGINDNMHNLQLYQASMNNAQAVSLIGKVVKAPGNSIHLSDGISNDIHFELGADARSVLANIYSTDGRLVKTIDAGPLSAGDQTLTWDGTDNEGGRMPDGVYAFGVSAVDARDAVVDAGTFSIGTVNAVNFEDGTARLMVGGMEIPMSSVLQVTETED